MQRNLIRSRSPRKESISAQRKSSTCSQGEGQAKTFDHRSKPPINMQAISKNPASSQTSDLTNAQHKPVAKEESQKQFTELLEQSVA